MICTNATISVEALALRIASATIVTTDATYIGWDTMLNGNPVTLFSGISPKWSPICH